ncbi:MAG: hypothetical protein JOZ95_18450 [Solirubrobacterales bacterium]|nr:hypothetical protein [Solirubrobacterales bacterium]
MSKLGPSPSTPRPRRAVGRGRHREGVRRAAQAGLGLALAGALAGALMVAPAGASARPFVDGLTTVTRIASTVPASGTAAGDQNPYGTAVVPRSVGDLTRGDVLVSDFNDAGNDQGTGASIMEISPSGRVRQFAVVPQATATPAVGLTTALIALRSGYVIVGSLPAPGGQASAARAGALIVLNAQGRVVERFTGGAINGPWDLAGVDGGSHVTLFVTNVLNGTVAAKGATVDRGTVVRLTLQVARDQPPRITSERVIATGLAEHTDRNALIVGPTGVALGAGGVLYVADTAENRITTVPSALTRTQAIDRGRTLSKGGKLNSPLGLTIAPNGDVLTVNAGDGNIVETTASGKQTGSKTLVPDGAGDLFGLALTPAHTGVYFVNDSGSGTAANSLELLH